MELRLPLDMSPGREAACRAVFGTWGFFPNDARKNCHFVLTSFTGWSSERCPVERLKAMGRTEEEAHGFAAAANAEGLAACEALLANVPGPFCFGAQPGLADILLIPQLASARRF